MRVVPEFHMGKFTIADIGAVPRIVDGKGRDVMGLPGGMQRLVDCANALSKINGPQTHVDATEDYVKRLEGLRKDVWARVQELEAQIAAHALVPAA